MTTTTAAARTTTTTVPELLPVPRVLEFAGNRLELLVEGRHNDRFSLVRYTVAPGFAAPPTLHHHLVEDTAWLVLSGRLLVTGGAGDLEVEAGRTALIPHGTPFAWRNGSDTEPMTYLCVYAPGGFEQYFVAVAEALQRHGALTPDLVAPLWQRYGIAVSPA
jgi:mannose-6-phosphate isomerase-like protein (cupin superfamily)